MFISGGWKRRDQLVNIGYLTMLWPTAAHEFLADEAATKPAGSLATGKSKKGKHKKSDFASASTWYIESTITVNEDA